MAKNKEESAPVEDFNAEVPSTPVVLPEVKPVRLVSFVQWASRRNIKKQHIGGIMAHVQDCNRSRTVEDWDKAVADYY